MAYSVINEHRTTGASRYDFVLDSAADVEDLPAAAPGSVAIVADKDGAVFMRNASGAWKEQ